MKKVIDFIIYTIFIIGTILVFFYRDTVSKYIAFAYGTYNSYETKNIYTKDIDYLYFNKTDNFVPSNKQELINVLYTILDDGMENFRFHCSSEYNECENDLRKISDNGTLSLINNYVHPFNSFNTFNLSINNYGIVEINITKTYNENEILVINSKIHEIMNEIIKSDMSDYDKILAFHDYIINHTIYDEEESERINNQEPNINSNKAYDLFINGKSVCEGYTDALAIFLSEIGINNFADIWSTSYKSNTKVYIIFHK